MALAMWTWRITFQITCDCGQGVCGMVGRYHTGYTDSGKVKSELDIILQVIMCWSMERIYPNILLLLHFL